MKDYELLDAVGGVDPAYVAQAERFAADTRPQRAAAWIAAAACLCLIAAVAVPALRDVIANKGGPGQDSQVKEIVALTCNGCCYEATDIPEALTRFGLPTELTAELAGAHAAYLEPDGAGYRPSAVETDIELLEYAPAPCRGVYLVRDGEKYLAALFCNVIRLDGNASTGLETLYQIYEIDSAADIAAITPVDWHRNESVAAPIRDKEAIAAFYDGTLALTSYGSDDFQAEVFASVPEEQQPQAHRDFADDLHMLRLETKDGLRFYLEFFPSYGWLSAGGTLSYYRMDAAMDAWASQYLNG